MKRHTKKYIIMLEELEVNNAMLTGYGQGGRGEGGGALAWGGSAEAGAEA